MTAESFSLAAPLELSAGFAAPLSFMSVVLVKLKSTLFSVRLLALVPLSAILAETELAPLKCLGRLWGNLTLAAAFELPEM